jgi:hypothetical protein
MAERVSASRRWWQVPVWVLLLVPVACAPVFYVLTRPDGVSPATRADR